MRDDQHGTTTGYALGCRCDGCRRAMREAQRAYRAAHPRPYELAVAVDRKLLGDLLVELFPDGLTDDCPARRSQRERAAA